MPSNADPSHDRSGRGSRTVPWRDTYPERALPWVDAKRRLTGAGIALSVLLLGLKGFAAWITGSTAIIADAINSLLDVFSYTVLFIAVRLQTKPADLTHHYGHHRAEPLAGFIVAVLAAVLGGFVLEGAFARLLAPEPVVTSAIGIAIVAFVIGSKAVMSVLYRRFGARSKSPALEAAAVDSFNDVLASSVAMIGFLAGGAWDSIAGMAIGAWIIYSGALIGLRNIGYLMGNAPAASALEDLRVIARGVKGVRGTNNIRAHYVGNALHVEIHIEVDEHVSIGEAHDIAKEVGERLEQVEGVHAVFVHTDPVGTPDGRVML